MRHLPPNIHQHRHSSVRQPPWWMLLPAYTLLPLARRPLGYDVVNPMNAFSSLALIGCAGEVVALFDPAAAEGFDGFAGFLSLSFVAACITFYKRTRGQRRGEEIHTLEAGYCYLTWRDSPLPVPLIEQVLVPAALALAGWGIAHSVAPLLGWWLFASGFSYALMARWEYRMLWAGVREPVNQMIGARLFEQRLDQHERAARRSASGKRRTDWYDADGEPDVAGIGKHRQRTSQRPADPPDMAGWNAANDSPVPDSMAWFRRWRRRNGAP